MTLNPKIFDKALELEDTVTRTATGSGAGVAFPLVPAYPYNVSHQDDLHTILDITALALSGATIVATVEVDSASNFPSPTEVARLPVTATGRFELIASLVDVKTREPSAAWIRTTVTVTGGSSPSITYRSFITKC